MCGILAAKIPLGRLDYKRIMGITRAQDIFSRLSRAHLNHIYIFNLVLNHQLLCRVHANAPDTHIISIVGEQKKNFKKSSFHRYSWRTPPQHLPHAVGNPQIYTFLARLVLKMRKKERKATVAFWFLMGDIKKHSAAALCIKSWRVE
jgi:hypothetical protein